MSNDFPFNHFINFNDNKNNGLEQKNIQNHTFPVLEDKKDPVQNQSLTSDSFSGQELKSICEEILIGLKQSISPQKYKAFFENTITITAIDENAVYFSVTSNFIKKMIDTHYLDEIKQILFTIMGTQYNLEISVLNTPTLNSTINEVSTHLNTNVSPTINNPKEKVSFKLSNSLETQSEIQSTIESKEIKYNTESRARSRHDLTKRFDNFIVGPSNNMAHAFSLAIAKDPGKVYPQLYIHGNSGLGKTHLLHAICNHVGENNPHLRICFTNANAFMSEMVLAIQSTTGKDNKISQFRRKYTELVDILIIDDIHELRNKNRTQAEFFYIFNELQNKNKQLVFTSDKAPKEIIGIEDRIRTRLSSALLIDIQQPDLETRIAILKKKAIEKDIYLDDEVINLIASCVKTNVRELEGKLVKLGAYSDLMNVDIDLEIAKDQLNLSQEDIDKDVLTLDLIAKVVSNYYKITLGDIKGKSRKKDVAMARHMAMFISHQILKKTLEEIGEYFSNRDHSTVIHGVKKIQNLIKDDSKIAQQKYEIESRL